MGFPVVFDNSGEGTLSSTQSLTASYATIQYNTQGFPAEAGYSAGVFTCVNDNTQYSIDYQFFFSGSTSTQGLKVRWRLIKGGITSLILTR
jgi:hypothetical protein